MGYVILGTLAAFGAFSALWAVFGCLFVKDRGLCLVFLGAPPEQTVRYVRWLRSLGLLGCPLIAVAEAGEDSPDLEICSGKDLLSRLEWEKNRGTGNGDHSGHHQRGGVPEL